MSISVEYRPQPPHLGMDYDANRFQPQPHFTNPWQTSAANTSALYQASYQHSPTQMEHSQVSRPQAMSMGYSANPAASSLGSELVPTRSYGAGFASSAPSSQSVYAPTTQHQRFSPEQPQPVNAYNYDQDLSRRSSLQNSTPSRASFNDEMASARGMVAMANSYDLTPRAYPGSSVSRTSSHDSYGFPPTHSHSSSISSASTYPYYSSSYQGSVDGSVTDYSSASEEMPRPLPAPSQVVAGFQTEPGAMMSSFNTKIGQSTQKKHKCKICEKRFTRPSSLQTHMYSHTGEKPYACDYHGCGRHFSVVSNLRRHKKVHKDDNGGSLSADDE